MRFLAFLVFLLFCVFALFARQYYVCDIKNLCEEEVEIVEEPRLSTLRLTVNDTITIMDGFDQFVFDSTNYSPRLNANNELFLDSIAGFFLNDTSKNLSITGFYRISEDSIPGNLFQNLGLERANSIRQLLVKRGLDESRVALDHGIAIYESLEEPLLFDAYSIGEPDEYAREQYSFKDYPVPDAYFDFDSHAFEPGKPFEVYADSLKSYMLDNTDQEVIITGHTDSKGAQWYNNKLGLKRAKSVKAYLEGKGVEAKIITKTEGENTPVASNDTEEGRQRNRRVNCKIE